MRVKTRRASGTSDRPRLIMPSVPRVSIRSPSSVIVPLRGLTRPKMVFMVVVLPAALAPSKQTISPLFT